MAKIRFKGVEQYALKLAKLGDCTKEVVGKAIYSAAEIVADTVKQSIESLPVDESYGTRNQPTHGLKQIQKDGLMESWGISSMQNDNGYYNVKLGFDGYNDLKTATHPAGQPNQMIARAIESGTSFSDKIPFVRPAVSASKSKAEASMERVLDEEIIKIMK